MRYGAVILAAGIASRMGDFKPLLPMGEESVIQNVVRVLREAGVQQIVVVTGYRKEVLEEHLKNASVMFVSYCFIAEISGQRTLFVVNYM